MKRTVWADQHVTATVNSSFVPVMVDVDDPSTAELRERFKIVAPPNITIVDSQQSILHQNQGGMGKEEFLELLATVTPAGR